MKIWAALFVCLMAVSGRRYWHRSRNAGNHNISAQIHRDFLVVPLMCINRKDKTFQSQKLEITVANLEKFIVIVKNAAKDCAVWANVRVFSFVFLICFVLARLLRSLNRGEVITIRE